MPDDDKTDPGATPVPAPKPAAPKPAPKKGFDPASIKGGKQPGGKTMRSSKMTMPGKSRGRG